MTGKIKSSFDSYKTVFLACICCICIVAVYLSFVVPHKNYLHAAEQYEITRSNLEKKKQIISNDVKIKKIELKELNKEYEYHQTKVFNPVSAREFFSNIENITAQSGCKVNSLKFSPENMINSDSSSGSEKNKYFSADTAQLSILGKYGNIVSLIEKLQGNAKLVKISSLKINSDNVNPGYLRCDMTITIFVKNEMKDD